MWHVACGAPVPPGAGDQCMGVCRKKGKKTADAVPAPAAAADEEDLGKEVEAIPAFSGFGPRFKSCKAVAVTEEDTEYDVSCVKHVFGEHIVLQFNCMNTISEQVRTIPALA